MTTTEETAQVRLLAGETGWWAVCGSRVARLPEEAVIEGQLRGTARSELADAGFLLVPDRSTYAVTVLTATACNLGCAYCFPEHGSGTTRQLGATEDPDTSADARTGDCHQAVRRRPDVEVWVRTR